MYRRAIRSLFAATTALLLCATACDKPEEKKADDKKAEPEKADVKAPEPEPQPEPPQPEPPQPEVNAEAGADAGAEAGADAGADAGAEGGEPTPAAEEGGEDKPAEKKPADKPTEKKPEAAANNINAKPLFDAKCKSCHGADGKGETTIGKKVNIPSLVGTSMSKAKIVSVIENGVPDTKMKGYKDKLSKDEIEALAGYVKKL